MDKNCLAYGIEIPDSDWEKTPPSVKQLVEKMGQFTKELEKKLTDLEAKQQELLEKINRTSKNSSSPPSSDRLNAEKKKEKKKSGLKRGGQPGHKGHSRFLYDVSECESVLEHRILNSDRYASYNWVGLEQRQLCWAHLKREFIKISERAGVSQDIGNALVKQQQKLFELWHRVRDGTLSRCDFQLLVPEIRDSIKSSLEEAANYSIGPQEKTPLAKTVRTCRQILKVEPALWLFVEVEGVEPTNNAAERAIRPAVIWRRTSFGSQTLAGSNFVQRMLTVVTTLKSQRRNVLEFMTRTVSAKRLGQPTPTLLPQVPVA